MPPQRNSGMAIDKKEHIINVAIELFSEKGFEGTSIRDLAAKAAVNVAMINYYFGSKENLFKAMVEYRATYIRERLEEITNNNKTTEIEKLDAIIEHYVYRFLTNHKYHRVIHQELLLEQREEIHDTIIKVFSKNKDIIYSIIEKGIKKKVFKKVDIEFTIVTLIGTINQATLSKSMCSIMMDKGKDFDLYTDEIFRKRIVKHLKQVIHSHLLIEQ